MPLELTHQQTTILLRRSAFESHGLTRASVDERLGLTADEFRVEGDLVAIGPLPPSTDVAELIELLEGVGLKYFDDFFDFSGNWPDWLSVFAMAQRQRPRT